MGYDSSAGVVRKIRRIGEQRGTSGVHWLGGERYRFGRDGLVSVSGGGSALVGIGKRLARAVLVLWYIEHLIMAEMGHASRSILIHDVLKVRIRTSYAKR